MALIEISQSNFDAMVQKMNQKAKENDELKGLIKGISSELDGIKNQYRLLTDTMTHMRNKGKGLKNRQQKVAFGRYLYASYLLAKGKTEKGKAILGELHEQAVKEPENQIYLRTEGASSKALSGGVDASIGYLVMDDISTVILELVEEYSLLNKYANYVQTNSNLKKAYQLLTGVDVYWISENTVLPETNFTVGEIEVAPSKMAAMIKNSSEIEEDTFIDLAEYLAVLIARSVSKEMERVAFVGDTGAGTPDPFDGILNNSSLNLYSLATTQDDFADATADDYSLAQDEVDEKTNFGECIWVMHRTNRGYLARLKDTTDNYIYQRPSDQNSPAYLWENKLETSNVMPKKTDAAALTYWAFYGNLKNLMVVERRALTIKTSEHAYMAYDQMLTIFTKRVAFYLTFPETFVRMRTGATS